MCTKAILIYSNSLRNDFIYFDDPELVTENYSIREFSWSNIRYFFTTPFQFTYLPIGLLSYAVDYRLGGLDPFVYHLDSLLIHLADVALVFLVFRRLTHRATMAVFVCAAFALHPVNVDSVAWIATRNNLLATFFFLAALLFYDLYLERRFHAGFLGLSVAAFALSALSKSSSVVLPLILLLWDYFAGRSWSWRLLLEKTPFLVISLALGVLTLNVRSDLVPPADYSLLDRVFIFAYALVDYVWRLLLPLQLSMSYAYPAKAGGWLPAPYYLAPFVLAAIVWILHRLGTSRRVLVFGLLYFVLNIALSQSVLLIDNFMANRYAYLAYPGLFLILAELNERILRGGKAVSTAVRPAWTAALVVFAVGFAILTYGRNFVWRDTIALFDDVIAKQPSIPWVYSNRGVAKYRVGDYAGALNDFNRSLELDSRFALSLYYRGVLSREAGNYPTALADLDATISLVPDFAPAYNDRGEVRRDLGDPDGALQDFSQAIALNPRFVEAYFNRGTLRHEFGDHAGAIADLDLAIADYPQYAEAYYQRAGARLAVGLTNAACSDARTALELGFQPSAPLIELACP